MPAELKADLELFSDSQRQTFPIHLGSITEFTKTAVAACPTGRGQGTARRQRCLPNVGGELCVLPAVTQPWRGRGLGRQSVHPYLALTSVEGTGRGSQKIDPGSCGASILMQ